MSYILDAIRKSDQQRQHGSPPTLLSAHGIAAAPGQSAFLRYGIVAALVLAAGIAIGWLRPWQSAPQPVAPAIVATPVSPPPVASAPMQQLPEQKFESLQRAPESKSAPIAQTGAVPAAATSSAAGAAPENPKQAPAPIVATGTREAAGAVPAAASPDKTVMSLAELPPALQQEIPRMAISVHAYSGAPANRLVGINDQLLREGDTLSPGIRLDEITTDGMIFSYKGFRFRVGARGT